MKAKIKFFFLICLVLCVFSTLTAQTAETFDGYYDDAAVVNTTVKQIGKYKVSVKSAADEYTVMFSVEGERGYIASYNGKYQYWVYRRGFGYQDWVTPAFDMSQVDISKVFTSVDSRINLNRTGLKSSTLKPISSIPKASATTTPATTSTTTTTATTTTSAAAAVATVDYSQYYDDAAVVNTSIKQIGKYKVSVKSADDEYTAMFSVEGERGYIASYNGKYQYWVYRRGFGYQDWVTPAFDMSQVDISKLFTSVDSRIDLNRTGLKSSTLKPISSVPKVIVSSVTTTATPTTAPATTSTTTTTAPAKTSTTTTTATTTTSAVTTTAAVAAVDYSQYYDDAAVVNTSIKQIGKYKVSVKSAADEYTAMFSVEGERGYIASYNGKYQYWVYRRGFGYQDWVTPAFDMSQVDISKLFTSVDSRIDLNRTGLKSSTLKPISSVPKTSTTTVPVTTSNTANTKENTTAAVTTVYTNPDGLGDIAINGKVYSKTGFVKIPEITIIVGSGNNGVFVAGRSVVLTPYIIGKYEVTQELYQAVTGETPSKWKADTITAGEKQNLRPVETVDLFKVALFCNKLSEIQGLQPAFVINGNTITVDITKNGWRIPTEAEWECAARGGDPANKVWNYKYAGTDSDKDALSYMWIKSNSNAVSHEVGLKQPNSLGLYDMLGNVYEWCLDTYNGTINKKTMINPIVSEATTTRVQRSTAYDSQLGEVSRRDNGAQDKSYTDLGFRLCRTAE